MREQITIRKRIRELAEQHGSLRAAARAIEVDVSYLYRLGNGDKTEPSNLVLRRMGLKRAVVYEKI